MKSLQAIEQAQAGGAMNCVRAGFLAVSSSAVRQKAASNTGQTLQTKQMQNDENAHVIEASSSTSEKQAQPQHAVAAASSI